MLIAIGANGLAKQIYPHFKGSGLEIVFFDDTKDAPKNLYEYQVIRSFKSIEDQIKNGIDAYFTICIGNPKWRKHFYDKMIKIGATPVGIEAQTATVNDKSEIGEGNTFLDYVLIEPDSKIGNNNLINCYAGIFHDVEIGNHNEIMPGAKILGSAKIGNRCRIGTNSSILPGVKICDDVIIGAGAVVTNDIRHAGTYVGMPARRVR